jgi:hypothetical protein
MTDLELAILGLQQTLETPRRHRSWRRLVRNRLAGVRDALARDSSPGGDAWLAAREMSLRRDRNILLGRLAVLGPRVLDSPDGDAVHTDLERFVQDLERYRQRLNDLVYDSVSLELGGSE